MTRAERIAEWLRGRASAAGARGFVFGLSGGIDSAVVARLCQIAAPQPVLKVTACTDHHHGHDHDPAFDLMRAAYHLGNRHVPIELRPDHLKIEPDHVLADMLRAMHLNVAEVRESFEPEGGAYAAGHGHGHHHGGDHGHGHDHDHHGHDHGHGHHPAHAHDHG